MWLQYVYGLDSASTYRMCVSVCVFVPPVPVRSLTLFYSYHAEIAWTAIWLVFAIHL